MAMNHALKQQLTVCFNNIKNVCVHKIFLIRFCTISKNICISVQRTIALSNMFP